MFLGLLFPSADTKYTQKDMHAGETTQTEHHEGGETEFMSAFASSLSAFRASYEGDSPILLWYTSSVVSSSGPFCTGEYGISVSRLSLHPSSVSGRRKRA